MQIDISNSAHIELKKMQIDELEKGNDKKLAEIASEAIEKYLEIEKQKKKQSK